MIELYMVNHHHLWFRSSETTFFLWVFMWILLFQLDANGMDRNYQPVLIEPVWNWDDANWVDLLALCTCNFFQWKLRNIYFFHWWQFAKERVKSIKKNLPILMMQFRNANKSWATYFLCDKTFPSVVSQVSHSHERNNFLQRDIHEALWIKIP